LPPPCAQGEIPGSLPMSLRDNDMSPKVI